MYSSELAPYVDLLAVSEGARPSTAAWLERNAPEARVLVTGRDARSGDAARTAR